MEHYSPKMQANAAETLKTLTDAELQALAKSIAQRPTPTTGSQLIAAELRKRDIE